MGLYLKAKKVFNASFDIDLMPGEKSPIKLGFEEGSLFLAVKGLLLSGNENWYEIPLNELQKIEVVEGDPPQLLLSLSEMDIIVKSTETVHLRALTHFLQPFLPN